MKKTKILVPALAVLALGMAASVTGTVAWFAANNVVNANGMLVRSTTPSSLVIGKTIGANGIGKATAIDFETGSGDNLPSDNVLAPASHFDGGEHTENGTLYSVTNGNDVDPVTGLAMAYDGAYGADALNNNTHESGADGYRDLEYTAAVADGSRRNYVDYVCYIASAGGSAITLGTGGFLQVKVSWTGVTQTTNAATVDFWVKANATSEDVETLGEYKGCLNATGVLASSDHAGAPIANDADYNPVRTAGEGVTYVTLMSPSDTNHTIPTNAADLAIRVTMRVYIDGALLQNKGKAYVTTNDVSTAELGIATTFTVDRGTN